MRAPDPFPFHVHAPPYLFLPFNLCAWSDYIRCALTEFYSYLPPHVRVRVRMYVRLAVVLCNPSMFFLVLFARPVVMPLFPSSRQIFSTFSSFLLFLFLLLLSHTLPAVLRFSLIEYLHTYIHTYILYVYMCVYVPLWAVFLGFECFGWFGWLAVYG